MNATSITLRWGAPLYKASSVTEYRVEYRVQSESLLGNATISDPTQTTYTVVDLTPGASYQLRIIPVNSIGDGPPTNTNARTGTYYIIISIFQVLVLITAYDHMVSFAAYTLYASFMHTHSHTHACM